ncbi:hypothetical protein ACVJA9_002769 [Bradyrhizobium diazoefficiens]
MTRHRQPLAERGGVARQAAGQAQQEAGERDGTDQGDHGKGRAPSEQAPDEIAERDADHGRNRQSRGDQRHRAAAPFRRGDRHGHRERRRHAQPGAQGHQHPGSQKQGVAGSHHRGEISGNEGRQRQSQHSAAVDIVQRHRQDRRAYGIGEGIGGDQLAGGRDRNRQVGGDRRQKPCDNKAFGADREGAQGQPEYAHWRDPYVQCLLNYRTRRFQCQLVQELLNITAASL